MGLLALTMTVVVLVATYKKKREKAEAAERMRLLEEEQKEEEDIDDPSCSFSYVLSLWNGNADKMCHHEAKQINMDNNKLALLGNTKNNDEQCLND